MKLKENAKCEKIARTGRVESWLESPEGRLPVSCTVFVVEDAMEGPNGIEQSWRFVSHGLRNGAGVAVHLSKLRGKGEENGKGLVASGPVSFGKIYSSLNEILRRGGLYKNGAVVLHLDYNHPDVIEFITASRQELPWVKRCLNVDNDFLINSSPELIDAALQKISSGDLWLNKIRYDEDGKRIYANVCLEVYLPHRGTCLLQHVNMGACEINEIRTTFVDGMEQLCKLHSTTKVDSTGEYLSPAKDRQVGLGMIGLANFLAAQQVSYKDFGDALTAWLNKDLLPWTHIWCDTTAGKIVIELSAAIADASLMAQCYLMDRAFAIAPTASCSYRYLDKSGFTTAPEIAPPIARLVDRDSGTFGVESFDYGNVETAEEVGWENYCKVVNGIATLYEYSGLFHGYSFNSWSDMVAYDRDFLANWLESSQTSLYYSLQVLSDTQRKDDAYAALDDDFKDMFGLNDSSDENEAIVSFEKVTNFCSSCAE